MERVGVQFSMHANCPYIAMVAHDSKHTCNAFVSLDSNLEDDNVPDTAPINRIKTPVNDEEEAASSSRPGMKRTTSTRSFRISSPISIWTGMGFPAIGISISAADRANPPNWRPAFLAAFAAKAPSIHVDGVNQFCFRSIPNYLGRCTRPFTTSLRTCRVRSPQARCVTNPSLRPELAE